MPDMDEIITSLEDAAIAEGTEVGELWVGLCRLWRMVDYGMGYEFSIALEQEIREQYNWLHTQFKWIECSEAECLHCGRGGYKRRELVFIGEEEIDE